MRSAVPAGIRHPGAARGAVGCRRCPAPQTEGAELFDLRGWDWGGVRGSGHVLSHVKMHRAAEQCFSLENALSTTMSFHYGISQHQTVPVGNAGPRRRQ